MRKSASATKHLTRSYSYQGVPLVNQPIVYLRIVGLIRFLKRMVGVECYPERKEGRLTSSRTEKYRDVLKEVAERGRVRSTRIYDHGRRYRQSLCSVAI